MKREHFEHVVERFNLETNWDDTVFSDIRVDDLYVESQKNYTVHAATQRCWWICDKQHYVFDDIVSEEEAKRMLEYIKATEILFV